MKKIILLFLLTLTGCFNSSNSSLEVEKNPYENIPVKNEPDGFTIEASSVNTRNIDNYLFRDDTMYVDLRYYSWVLSQGHIAGFSFFPFYELIAAMDNSENDNKLFSYKKESPICEVGSFSPNYEESEFLLYNLFPVESHTIQLSWTKRGQFDRLELGASYFFGSPVVSVSKNRYKSPFDVNFKAFSLIFGKWLYDLIKLPSSSSISVTFKKIGSFFIFERYNSTSSILPEKYPHAYRLAKLKYAKSHSDCSKYSSAFALSASTPLPRIYFIPKVFKDSGVPLCLSQLTLSSLCSGS